MEPWFNPSMSWLPGTALGVTCGLLGTMAGILAPRGVGRPLIINLLRIMIGASLIMLMAAIIGYFQGQPYAVWYGLGLAGLIGTVVLTPNYFTIRKAYTSVELRKMDAVSIRH